MARSSNIRSVERAFGVLRALSPKGQAVPLAAIAECTGLPKSTVSRLLSTMAGIGVVERVSKGGYVVGRELRIMVHPGVSPADLVAVSASHLRNLVREMGEDAALSIPDGDRVVFVEHIQRKRPVQVQDWTGDPSENHMSASGYVLLSSWDDEDLDAYLARPLINLSRNTEVDPIRLRNDIGEVRRLGYAWVFEAWMEGVNGVAAPIVDAGGEMVAFINIFGPSYRFPGDADPAAIGERLIETAAHVARHLRVV